MTDSLPTPQAELHTSKILSREELGDMYFDLRDKFHSYFSPWSNMPGPQGDPEATKRDLREKMDAIEKELGHDFLFACSLKRENGRLEKKLESEEKTVAWLRNRVERLEECVVELYSSKWSKIGTDAYDFRACESKIPSRS